MACFECSRLWLSALLIVAVPSGCTRDNPAFGDQDASIDTDAGGSTSSGGDSTTRPHGDAEGDASATSGIDGASTDGGDASSGPGTVTATVTGDPPGPCDDQNACLPGDTKDCEHGDGLATCGQDCKWDATACAVCGDGILQAGEECEPELFPQFLVCAEQPGLSGNGVLTCSEACEIIAADGGCCVLLEGSCELANVNECCDDEAECTADGDTFRCLIPE
jgi:hypothetical protein